MAEGDIADNWEEFDDSGALDKQLEQFPKITILKKPPSTASPVGPDQPVTMVEDNTRTAFTPQVKILKRQQQPTPDQNQQTNSRGSAAKPSLSLAEREAAYAEARQRIFGNDKPQQASATPPPPPPPAQQKQQQQQNQQDNRMNRVNQQMQGVRLSNNNVTRQPRGPDGSHGFPRSRQS